MTFEKLGKIARIKTGKLNSNAAVPNGRYPFFTCSPETLRINNHAFDQKAILLAGNNAEGNFSIKYYEGKFNAYQRTYVINCIDENICNLQYLYYALSLCLQDFKVLSQGTSTRFLTAQILNNFDVSLPSINNQYSIVHILSCIDDKIALNQKINHNLEQQAQAIFDNWLDSEISEQWPLGILSDLAVLNPLRSLKKGSLATYVEMSNLPTSGAFPSNWETKVYAGGAKFQNGDTLLARITPCLENGKTAYVNFLQNEEVAFGSTEYIILSSKDGYPSEVLYLLARNKDFVSFAIKNMSGTTGRQRVSAEALVSYEMKIPPRDFIASFAKVFSEIMNTIKNNSLENRSLAALRDTLLPKLMSGEIDVSDVKI